MQKLLKEKIPNGFREQISTIRRHVEWQTKDIYREELGIINYIPENLEYEALKLITGIGHNYYSAETDLVTEAFKLSTDGIINVTLNSTSSTKVMGGANNTSVYSSIETTVHLQGMAIKLI